MFCRRHIHVIFSESCQSLSKRFFALAATNAAPPHASTSNARFRRGAHTYGFPSWEHYRAARKDPDTISQLSSPKVRSLIDCAPSLDDYRLIFSDTLHASNLSQEDRRDRFKRLWVSPKFHFLKAHEAFTIVDEYRKACGGFEALNVIHFVRLMAQICRLDTSATSSADDRLLLLLLPGVLHHIRHSHTHGVRFNPLPIHVIRHASIFIRDLLRRGQHEPALEVFQLLLEKSCIEAIPDLAATEDFRVIVLLTLASASMNWNWPHNAVLLVTDALKECGSLPPDARPAVASIVLTVMHRCLQDGRKILLRYSLAMLRSLHFINTAPQSAVHHLYKAFKAADLPDLACELYYFVNRDNVAPLALYPSPPSDVIPWLLRSLHARSAASQYTRLLVTDAARPDVTLPVQDRAAVITLAARSGFGLLTRQLWATYSQGPDKIAVTGNNALLLRMASLFSHVRDSTATRARYPEKGDDLENLRARAADSEDFLDSIFREYVLAHTPIEDAPHQQLTTYARALFMAGRDGEAMKVYKILKKRKTIPDIYDVNTILKSLAQRKPRTAAKMIDRMIDRGVAPDGVTFGTVLHHALEHDDLETFNQTLAKAAECKVPITTKTLVSLVRYNASSAITAEPEVKKPKFLGLLGVVKGMSREGLITSVHLGKFLVHCALKADLPVFAFRFWSLTLRRSAQWDDKAQVQIRSSLAKGITNLCRDRRLGVGRTKVMLQRLGRLYCWPTNN